MLSSFHDYMAVFPLTVVFLPKVWILKKIIVVLLEFQEEVKANVGVGSIIITQKSHTVIFLNKLMLYRLFYNLLLSSNSSEYL